MIEDRIARNRVRSLTAAVKRLGRAAGECSEAVLQETLEDDQMGFELRKTAIDAAIEETEQALTLIRESKRSLPRG